MAKTPDFDVAAAHKYFSAHCFNSAWELIDKPQRTPDEDRRMVTLNQASIFHWSNRPDCEPMHLSVGYWQASRIQAILGNAAEARRHGEVCLAYSQGLAPFYLGYAHEALARAAWVAGDAQAAARELALAQQQAAAIERAEDRALLVKDLEQLR